MPNTIAYLEAVVGADITSFRRGMYEVRQSLLDIGGLSQTLRNVGRTMTLGMTIPLLIFGGAAVDQFSKFEEAMRNVNSMTLLGQRDFETLSQAVLQFGSSIRSGPLGAAEALYTVIGAGWENVDEALRISQVSARTAEAGMADLGVTTEAVVAALLSYSAGVDEAERYSDILTRMVQVGVGTMDEFAGAIAYTLPAAAALKVPFEDVATVLAYLTQRGFSATRGATSLNNALNKLLNPSEQLTAVFQEMGVATGQEFIEKFGGVQGALNALFESAEGRPDILAELFPDERGRRAILLAAEDLEMFNQMFEDFASGSQGATMAAWQQQAMTLSYAFDRMTAAGSGFLISVGAATAPVLKPIIEGFTQLLLNAMNLNPQILALGAAFLTAVAAAGPLLWLLGALLTPIGLVMGLIAGLGTAIATNLGGLGDVFNRILRRFQVVFAHIGLAIEAFIRGFNLADTLKAAGVEGGAAADIVSRISTGLQLAAPYLRDAANYIMQQFGYYISQAIPAIDTFVSNVLNGIADLFRTSAATGKTPIYEAVRALLSGDIEAAINAVAPGVGTSVANLFSGIEFPQIAAALQTLFANIGQWILDEGIPTLSRTFGYVAGRIGVAIGQALGAIGGAGSDLSGVTSYLGDNVIGEMTGGFQDALSDAGMGNLNIGDQVVTWVAGAIVAAFAGSTLLGLLTPIGGHLATAMLHVLGGTALRGALVGGVGRLIGGMGGAVTRFAPLLLNPAGLLIAGFVAILAEGGQLDDFVQDVRNSLLVAGEGISRLGDGFKDLINGHPETALPKIADGLATLALGILNIPVQLVWDLALAFGNLVGLDIPGMLAGWQPFLDYLKIVIPEALNNLSTKITEWLNTTSDAIAGWLTTAKDNIVNAFNSARDAVLGALQSIADKIQEVLSAAGLIGTTVDSAGNVVGSPLSPAPASASSGPYVLPGFPGGPTITPPTTGGGFATPDYAWAGEQRTEPGSSGGDTYVLNAYGRSPYGLMHDLDVAAKNKGRR